MQPGDNVFFANLEKKFGEHSFALVGKIGPFPTPQEASDCMDRVVASREGEQLLEMLEIDRIRILQTVMQ